MKTLRHLFTALLLLCATAATAHNFEVDGIYYNVTDATNKRVEVTIGTKNYTGDVRIPANVIYDGTTYSVTTIGDRAFQYCSSLTSITIPNSVTTIGDRAFYNCSSLTSVIIGNSVTTIGAYAFDSCTSLASITIPNSVTTIEYGAFYDCSKLSAVINFSNLTFSRGNSSYGHIAYYANKVINAPNGFIDGDYVWANKDNIYILAGYLGNAAQIKLPADYNGNNYVIGDYAFLLCYSLTSVTM